MKMFFISFCLLTACIGAYAQKSYVTVVASALNRVSHEVYLTGDLPSDIKAESNTSCGHVLNLLSQHGYEVEQMTGASTSATYVCFLLSKKTSSNPYNSIRQINSTDKEATEVARYNLQGMPISENEKGVQIVVYSNYTTKTVIVQ